MRLRLFTAVVAGTLAVVTTPVQAQQTEQYQTQFEFTPHIGMYFPLNPVVREPGQIMRQLTAVVLGGRFTVAPSKHWSVEGTIDYSPSQVAVTQNSRTNDINGGLLLASIKTVRRFGAIKPKTPELQIAAGIGLINRFGQAWSDHTGTTDPAAVVAFGGRMPLGEWMPLNVRFEIENYISRVQFSGDGGMTNKRVNHDTFWSFGFELPLNN